MNAAGFKDLGDQLQDDWARLHFDDDAFPELATQALEQAPVGDFDLPSLLRTTLANPALVQANAHPHPFGNLSMKLYQATDFHIELLVWTDSLTDIHEHGFGGALRVFEGGSLHCLYRFEEEQRLGSRLIVGEAQLHRAELLEKGDVRTIVPGHRGLVHSLFHLARPSATLVARTETLPRFQPQYSLRPPCFALDVIGLSQDPEVRLASRALDTLASIDWPAALDFLRELSGRLDFPRWLAVLEATLRYFYDDAQRRLQLRELLVVARHRYGEMAERLEAVVDFRLQVAEISALRLRVHEPDLRFFLALLLNVPSGERIFELIEQTYPGRSGLETAISWLTRLFEQGALRYSLRGDDAESYLRSILAGRTGDELIEALKAEFDAADVEAQRDSLQEMYSRISSLPVIQPLLGAELTAVQ